MANADKIRRGGRKAIGIGALAAILLVAWILSHFAGAGPGIGIGTAVESSGTPQTAPATEPAETEVVVITGDRYLAGGREMTLPQIIAAAGRPRPGHTAVMIVSGPDSRLGTRKDLQNALDSAGLSWGMQTDPAAP